MTDRASGHLGTKVVGDVGFVAHLGAGTTLTFTLSGKLGGTINGMPVSGSGSLEYTFRQGGTAWELVSDGLAQGPSLPAGAIVYLPSGASGNATVQTTGTLDTTGYYGSAKDKYHFKLKGRTASITVAVFTDALICSLPADCGAFASISGGCSNAQFAGCSNGECQQWVSDNLC